MDIPYIKAIEHGNNYIYNLCKRDIIECNINDGIQIPNDKNGYDLLRKHLNIHEKRHKNETIRLRYEINNIFNTKDLIFNGVDKTLKNIKEYIVSESTNPILVLVDFY